jgi:tyrosyl-tRNA synthetase
MMPGLLEGQEKMSKSNPDSAIFMEDSVEDVNRKIKKAYCPPEIVEGNPCLTYLRMLVMPLQGKFHVPRKEANGGDMYVSIVRLKCMHFSLEHLHPLRIWNWHINQDLSIQAT